MIKIIKSLSNQRN